MTTDRLDRATDAILEAAGELSASANRLSLPAHGASASIQNVNGATVASWIAGIVGTFAIVVAVSAVLVVWAFRSADIRVMDERAAQQRETNEDLQDRLRLIEVKVKKLEERK